MNCAEVTEWMHRYLDHDLSQDEAIEMFRHMDNCPSCAEIFERLSALSQSLEQLPDVKPPFSLVDAILPKLDELDQDRQHQEPLMAEEPARDDRNVVPFSRKVAHQKPVRGNSILKRTGIGAAAAAVLLFIAVFNMPEKMPGAEVENLLSNAADQAAGDNAAYKKEAPAKGMEKKAPSESGDEAGGGGAPGTFNAMKVNEGNQGDEAKGAAPTATMETADTTPSPQPEKTRAPERTKEPKKSNSNSSSTQKPTANHPAGDTAPIERMYSDTKGNSGQDSNAGALNQDSAVAQDGQAADGAKGFVPPGASVASATDQQSWTSPDGRHKITLTGRQLVVYALTPGEQAGEQQVLTSLPLDGQWVSGEWSQDGTQFTYVTSEQGAAVTKTYTLPQSGSSLPTSSPQPSSTPEGTASTN